MARVLEEMVELFFRWLKLLQGLVCQVKPAPSPEQLISMVPEVAVAVGTLRARQAVATTDIQLEEQVTQVAQMAHPAKMD